MRGDATTLDEMLGHLADFRRRFDGSGVVAQLVEHHNGIVSSSATASTPISSDDDSTRLFRLPSLLSVSPSDQPSPVDCGPVVSDAVAQLLAAKAAARRRPCYVRSLRQYLAQFIRGRESMRVSQFTAHHIEEWFSQRGESPSAQASNLGRLSALFSFSVRRGWIDRNPCDRVERVTVERRPPAVLDADSAARLLDACGPVIRPWVVLGLFAGLRPTEAEAMDWSAIRLAGSHPTLTVDAAASKVRRRRIVPLQSAAVVWLALDASQTGPVVSSHSTMRRARRDASEAAGVPWSADLLRHTFATMRLAGGAHAGDVANEMGNSPSILLTHYRELVRREDAERFWSLRPKSVATSHSRKETSPQ